MDKVNVSVVVPAHNCLRYTQEFFATLPMGFHDEIFIDNASTDTTQEWAKTMSFCYVRNPEPRSVAASWNQGIRLAFERGAHYVYVANNDSVLTLDTVPALMNWKLSNILDLPTVYQVADLKAHTCQRTFQKPPDFCGFLVNQLVMDKVGWFDENFLVAYCEDLDWALRASKLGVRMASCLDAPVKHYISRTITEGGVDHKAAFRHNADYFKIKHGITYEMARQIIST